MTVKQIEAAVEAILFASGEPVPIQRIAAALGTDVETVGYAADNIELGCLEENRGVRLIRLEDRLQLCSAPEYAEYVTHALETRRAPRLSRSALEALAIAAYYQPVTRAYIDKIRGVDSSYTVSLLCERGLLEPCGKLDAPGRPTLLRTTDAFLRTMGIKSLDELPPLPDITTNEGVISLQSKIETLKNAEIEGQLGIDGE